MSRRRGEFEHRTSIFEGAFRAWSHLGGLAPEELESKTPADLDPLSYPIENDCRLTGKKADKIETQLNPNGTKRRIYPYEPLPRSGLAHPYVQAILSPWLGPDADNDAIQLGLTTLRTWWQHRRKGESGSAIAALGTEKMKGVVEGYTRHFFTLAHCLVMNDKEQPPRSLHSKMKEVEKIRNKRKGKKGPMDEANGSLPSSAPKASDPSLEGLSPLERLHMSQQRQLAGEGGVHSTLQSVSNQPNPSMPIINITNKCVAGKVDLPAVVDAVNHHANQLAHSGSNRSQPPVVPSSVPSGSTTNYGEPDSIPIVFVCQNGDIMLSMSVDGITCAHCVKIVETVLRGCNGNKSPIDGLLDAAADRVLCSVLIKIDRVSNAKRVAFEAARNLAMVGYTAKAKHISSSIERDGKLQHIDIDVAYKAFQEVAQRDPRNIFDWNTPCSCPDNGVLRDDCSRHGQMSTGVSGAFDDRGMLTTQYLSGGSLQIRSLQVEQQQEDHMQGNHMTQQSQQLLNDIHPEPIMHNNGMGNMNGPMDGNMGDIFGGGVAMPGRLSFALPNGGSSGDIGYPSQRAQRNASMMSFGGGRNMSFASEVSYGRAMSGLSALSIDWENMDDFDVNVDHSAHINNPNPPAGLGGNDSLLDPKPMGNGGGGGGVRRSSLRVPFTVGGPGMGTDNDQHVSFKL